MIKCVKCGVGLKNRRKTILPNKTFKCENKCKPSKLVITKAEAPACDTIKGRQAIAIANPRNILKNKPQVLVYDNIAPLVVNGDTESKKFLHKGGRKKKEIEAPVIEVNTQNGKLPKKTKK